MAANPDVPIDEIPKIFINEISLSGILLDDEFSQRLLWAPDNAASKRANTEYPQFLNPRDVIDLGIALQPQ